MDSYDIRRKLLECVCMCGQEKWNHDFGGGPCEESGCQGFEPAFPEIFNNWKAMYEDAVQREHSSF